VTVRKGNLSPRDAAEGSEITIGVEGNSGLLIRRGDYDELLAERPAAGTVMTTMGETLNVLSTKLVKNRGGTGTLSIYLGDGDVTGEGIATAEDRTETVELDYTLMEKPLENHPLFAALFAGTGYLIVKRWESIPAEAIMRKTAFEVPKTDSADPAVDADWEAITDELALLYCQKRLKGIESYFLQVPVVRKTSVLKKAATASKCGQRDTPPDFAAVQDVWLKTADKMRRTGAKGAWERMEEWTGFDELDEDLYPTPT
jgi:hypothetical protein